MKVALVVPTGLATDASERYVAALTDALATRVELDVVDERRAATVDPQALDRIVYQVFDDEACGFMAPLLRDLGGIAELHSWSLGRLALRAHPALSGDGLAAEWAAVREGGLRARRELARGKRPQELALNRSVVRFADAFFVHEASLGERVIEDRNAATPVGVLPRGPADLAGADALDELADAYVEFLERAPAPRSKKGGSILARVRRELAARRVVAGPGADPRTAER